MRRSSVFCSASVGECERRAISSRKERRVERVRARRVGVGFVCVFAFVFVSG